MDTRRRWGGALGALVVWAGASASFAQVTFYERDDFSGRSFTTDRRLGNLNRSGFNDRATSVVVERRIWEVCEDTRYRGRCSVLRQGRYPSLITMGLSQPVTSVRVVALGEPVAASRFAPEPVTTRDYRRRSGEPLYPVTLAAARAVVGESGLRCWVAVEPPVPPPRRGAADAPLGGILGHQTAGGGDAPASSPNIGRDALGQQTRVPSVFPCRVPPDPAPPDYWDIAYTFRGLGYRVQAVFVPGRTVMVNRDGAPRE